MAETIGSYVFYEIAALLALAAGIGFLGTLLRQPLIVSFIAVGLLAGPSGLDIARSEEHIDLLAELGIALLLFLVGLKLDLKMVRTLGGVSVMTGLGQVAFTTAFGFLIGVALGFDPITSLYVAVALTFSSTIIIVKLLSDKREIDSLHGRIALGFLIVQDLVVVLAMIVLSAMGVGASNDIAATEVLLVFGYGALLLLGIWLFIRYLANPLLDRLAAAPELLVSFAIGWAALLASLGDYLGFGKELGGLLAGISLASTHYRDALGARLASLRDFLLLFFFVALGASLDLSTLGESVGAALVLSAFVLIGNPLIVLVIMRFMGYSRRTGFLAGLTVAQISEFSLIFTAMGLSLGHVSDEALGLVTLVGLVTIAASTYMITYSHQLYEWAAPVLAALSPKAAPKEEAGQTLAGASGYDVIVFGLGRYGFAIADALRQRGERVLGVDFDPVAVRHARGAGLPVTFGDAADPEFLAALPWHDVRWAVGAIQEHATGLSHVDPRLTLIRELQEQRFRGRIAVPANTDAAANQLQERGAHLVLMPYRDAAAQAVSLILNQAAPSAVELVDPNEQKELAE